MAIGVYVVSGLIVFAIRGQELGVFIPLAAAFVLTRYSKPVAKEKAAIRGAVWLGAVGLLVVLVFLAMAPVEMGSFSEDGNDFTVSLVATMLVNFSIGAALGGLGGFVAEATRPARDPSSPPPPPPPLGPPSSSPPPSSRETDYDDPGTDLRDKWR